MKKALCFLLAIIFVCCVIVHGDNERFSLEAMITNLTNFQDMPTMQDLVDIWTQDNYAIDTLASAGGGDDSGTVSGGTTDEERTNFFTAVVDFFDELVTFVRRCWDSILLFVDVIVAIFDNVEYLLPWNNTVPRG
ncbi:MAG: hypothetical protein IJW55_09410 [Clostridia bacterium]|nr:hypothetical protein [Clostridia bacterium]